MSGYTGLEVGLCRAGDSLRSQIATSVARTAAGVECMGRTHYDVLGITPNATPALIRAAYKTRIRETHPDSGGDAHEASLVNAAFNVLGDEVSRLSYDRTLSSSPPPPSQPATPTPEPEPEHPPHDTVPFRPAGVAVPAWRRGGTWRGLLIVVGAWGAVAVIVALLALQRAREVSIDVLPPDLAALMLAALPAAVLAGCILRVRWWKVALTALAYAGFAGAVSLSGYGTVMLIITFTAAAIAHMLLSASRRELSRELVSDFWAATENPALSGWFIASSWQAATTCRVELVDIMSPGQYSHSATLWGRHAAGTYVIADMNSHPAQVLLTVTGSQMKLAQKNRARR